MPRKPEPPPTPKELKHYKKVLEEKIGKIGMTNHSPTLKAKLLSIDVDRCWLEVTEVGEDGAEKYNSDVGQEFYLPLRMTFNINFES